MIRCMLNTIDGPSEQVEDYLCDPEEMPLGARNSQLPCPGDCVLSDWGSWSPCPLVKTFLVHNLIIFGRTTPRNVTKMSYEHKDHKVKTRWRVCLQFMQMQRFYNSFLLELKIYLTPFSDVLRRENIIICWQFPTVFMQLFHLFCLKSNLLVGIQKPGKSFWEHSHLFPWWQQVIFSKTIFLKLFLEK